MAGVGSILMGLGASGIGGLLGALGEPDINGANAARDAFTNRFGEVGQVAAERAKTAFDNIGNTAGARFAANNLSNTAGALMGSTQAMADSNTRFAANQGSNLRRSAMDSVAGTGSSPAALAGMIARLKEQQAGITGALSQNNYAAVLGNAGAASNMIGQGQSILQNDWRNQFSKAQDQLADFNPAIFNANIEQQTKPSAWQGLAQGLSAGFGQIGGGLTGAGMGQMNTQNAFDDYAKKTISELIKAQLAKGGSNVN